MRLLSRFPLVLCVSVLALAACSPPVPESGVGFSDYGAASRQREAQLAGQAPLGQPILPPGAQVPGATGFSTDRVGAAIDAAEAGAAPGAGAPLSALPGAGGIPQQGAVVGADPVDNGLDPNRPRGAAPSNIRFEDGEVNNPGISDEQDFGAVSKRETIESDAERLARNRAQYQVIPPTALPTRVDTGPNIVAYALSTTHNPGTPMYRRSSLTLSNPMAACARYGSPDLAQEAFLAAGGPTKDRKGLDPDGDGFACYWDPRPFRAARQ